MSEYVWKKVLYKAGSRCCTTGSNGNCECDDSYTDSEAFLAGLKKNAHFRKYSFWRAFWQSLVVAKEVSTVQAFISVFSCALCGSITAATLIGIDVVLYSVSVLWLVRSQRARRKQNQSQNQNQEQKQKHAQERGRQREGEVDLWTLGILVVCAYGLSPVLSTLTSSFSSDSIYWSTGLLLVAHLYSYSYCPIGDQEWAEAPAVQSPVSLNAAVFASVLLASRLPTPAYVFGFVNYAVLLFVLLPHIKFTATVTANTEQGKGEVSGKATAKGNEHSSCGSCSSSSGGGGGDLASCSNELPLGAKRRHLIINIALFSCNFVLMHPISSAATKIYAALLVFICVMCPLLLLYLQRFKR